MNNHLIMITHASRLIKLKLSIHIYSTNLERHASRKVTVNWTMLQWMGCTFKTSPAYRGTSL